MKAVVQAWLQRQQTGDKSTDRLEQYVNDYFYKGEDRPFLVVPYAYFQIIGISVTVHGLYKYIEQSTESPILVRE